MVCVLTAEYLVQRVVQTQGAVLDMRSGGLLSEGRALIEEFILKGSAEVAIASILKRKNYVLGLRGGGQVGRVPLILFVL